ncbi:uncharacterized protein LOC129746070 [Uranotaenia lowii]|uniref:uncharacterized protein LOC129746070 n=1 Tax=Uranotaenia lowii TaxID=190385 RepID=UPI002479D78F|nr:uncharacterized protein LOC129746070 [Uranotaenia lowii]
MKLEPVIAFLVLCVGFSSAKLAPILTACSHNDPEFEKCVFRVVEKIRPAINSGNFGEGQPKSPSLEPIWIDRMVIDRGSGFKCKLTNVTIRGAGDFVMRRVKVNTQERTIEVGVKLPNMVAKGQYTLNMQLLVLRITGKGDFDLIMNNTLCNMRLKYDVRPGSGDDDPLAGTIQFRPIDVKLRFDKGRFQLQNLFGGDPALGEVGNQAINQDPHVLLDEVKPAFEQSLSKLFTDMANAASAGATEKDILPD